MINALLIYITNITDFNNKQIFYVTNQVNLANLATHADHANYVNLYILKKPKAINPMCFWRCQDIVVQLKFFLVFFTFIKISMKFRTACQYHQARENAKKCLSQGHNRMTPEDSQSDHVNHNFA